MGSDLKAPPCYQPVQLPRLYFPQFGPVHSYSMTNLRLPFECPICGPDGFTHISVRGRDGTPRLTQAYECMGCSTMFRERERFTRHRIRLLGADGEMTDRSKPKNP